MRCTFAFFIFGKRKLIFWVKLVQAFFLPLGSFKYSIVNYNENLWGQEEFLETFSELSLRWIDYFFDDGDDDGNISTSPLIKLYASLEINIPKHYIHCVTLQLLLSLAFSSLNASSLSSSLSLVVGYEDILMGKNNKWTWWEKRKMFRHEFRFPFGSLTSLVVKSKGNSITRSRSSSGADKHPMTVKWKNIYDEH